MPPRRPVRQQQQPATFMARVVKLAVMLALIYGGKVAFLSAMRAYGPRSAVDKLADPANVAAAMGADVGMKEPETPAEARCHVQHTCDASPAAQPVRVTHMANTRG